MSDPTATVPATIRLARGDDAAAVATALERLLLELGGKQPPRPEVEAEARAAVEEPNVGPLLLAEAEGEIVGMLSASWQRALHVPGRYATIQDLWVLPAWRSRAIGHDLIEALCELAREHGVDRIEVGLPKESFERVGATEAFYRANGFSHLGPRMRRLLEEEEER